MGTEKGCLDPKGETTPPPPAELSQGCGGGAGRGLPSDTFLLTGLVRCSPWPQGVGDKLEFLRSCRGFLVVEAGGSSYLKPTEQKPQVSRAEVSLIKEHQKHTGRQG